MRKYLRTQSITVVLWEMLAFGESGPYAPSKPLAKMQPGERETMEKHKFIFVRWPNGEWTIALDREYALTEIESFS